MSSHDDDPTLPLGRRELLKALAGAGGFVATRILLPAMWTAPLIASMPLPAHADMSVASGCVILDQTNDGAATGTLDAAAGIVPSLITGGLRLTITPPASLLANRTPYRVVEEIIETCTSGNGTMNNKTFYQTLATYNPSTSAALSGTAVLDLTRTKGTYKFQLRWNGGYTALVTQVVA